MSGRLRGGARVPLITACAVLAGGCYVGYRPTTAHATRDGDLAAKVVAIDVSSVAPRARVGVDVDVEAPPGDRVTALLAAPAAAPCAGGIAPVEVGEDLTRTARYHAGRRGFQFDQAEVEASGLLREIPGVLDLDLLPADVGQPRRCLRVPIAGTEASEQWRGVPPWFIGVGVRAFVPSGQSAIGAGWMFSTGGGIWLGRWRLRIDGLLGRATTARAPPAGFTELAANLLGGSVSAEAFLVRSARWGIGLQVGYELMVTIFEARAGTNTTEGTDTAGPRGPRAALRLARLPLIPSWPGFRTRSDAFSLGLDLYASHWTGIAGTANLHFGAALVAETGRWW
jgi:hypothetical protein